MKCEELLTALEEYLDREPDSDRWAALDEHLAVCPPCRLVVDNVRQTIALFRAGEPYRLPSPQHEHLCAALRAQWEGRR
jgi:predicted anti-sigma-YlaC factor YlaD